MFKLLKILRKQAIITKINKINYQKTLLISVKHKNNKLKHKRKITQLTPTNPKK